MSYADAVQHYCCNNRDCGCDSYEDRLVAAKRLDLRDETIEKLRKKLHKLEPDFGWIAKKIENTTTYRNNRWVAIKYKSKEYVLDDTSVLEAALKQLNKIKS